MEDLILEKLIERIEDKIRETEEIDEDNRGDFLKGYISGLEMAKDLAKEKDIRKFEVMEDIDKLMDDFYEYTTEISITEFELMSYYDEFKGTAGLEYEQAIKIIKEDIKNDFQNNIGKIKEQIENDISTYCVNDDITECMEFPYIIDIYNKIKNVYKDFYIKDLEGVM